LRKWAQKERYPSQVPTVPGPGSKTKIRSRDVTAAAADLKKIVRRCVEGTGKYSG